MCHVSQAIQLIPSDVNGFCSALFFLFFHCTKTNNSENNRKNKYTTKNTENYPSSRFTLFIVLGHRCAVIVFGIFSTLNGCTVAATTVAATTIIGSATVFPSSTHSGRFGLNIRINQAHTIVQHGPLQTICKRR